MKGLLKIKKKKVSGGRLLHSCTGTAEMKWERGGDLLHHQPSLNQRRFEVKAISSSLNPIYQYISKCGDLNIQFQN